MKAIDNRIVIVCSAVKISIITETAKHFKLKFVNVAILWPIAKRRSRHAPETSPDVSTIYL